MGFKINLRNAQKRLTKYESRYQKEAERLKKIDEYLNGPDDIKIREEIIHGDKSPHTFIWEAKPGAQSMSELYYCTKCGWIKRERMIYGSGPAKRYKNKPFPNGPEIEHKKKE